MDRWAHQPPDHSESRLLRDAVAGSPITVGLRRDHRCQGGAHSRLADDRLVCWAPAGSLGPPGAARPAVAGSPDALEPSPAAYLRFAVDAELSDQAVPRALGRLWRDQTPATLWLRWCVTEVVAKLADRPVVTLLREPPSLQSPVAVAGVRVHWTVVGAEGVTAVAGIAVARPSRTTALPHPAT